MLTPAQIEARRGKLTASRVACLMRGDAGEIMRLYRRMLGDEIEDDLSHVWAVRLGEATEQLQLDWLEEKSHMAVTRRGEVVVHPRHDVFACTLDGWLEELMCPIEVKHTGGREPLEIVIERYQPQLHFQMCCTNATQCAISVIRGADEPIVEYVEMDHDYGAELMRRGLQFMKAVHDRKPPVVLPPAPLPVSGMREYDMTSMEVWQRNAEQWIQCKGAADTATASERILKSLVPEDAKKCFGHGVRISRDRAGRLSLRMDR